jgi:hypothetical protein
MLAPIALFTYRRIGCLVQTIYALRLNELAEQSDLFVFSDGGKNASEWETVNFIRDYCKRLEGFKSVKVIPSEHNLGLATSIIGGVNWVLSQYSKVIVVEDDLVTFPYFLRYMNEALDFYENDERVICVSGYVYPIKGLPETFFVKGADCLGWGTWKRGWELFDYRSQSLLDGIRKRHLRREFDFNNSHPYYRMLKKKAKGKLDSWAILWYASAFLNDKYTLYPRQSLVRHIGNDLLATHRQNGDWLDGELTDKPIEVNIPEQIEYETVSHIFTAHYTYQKVSSYTGKRYFAEFFKNNRPCLRNYLRSIWNRC